MKSNNLNSTNQLKYVFITPHTHWDREWYLPFQKFRHMLVKLVDELLAIMKEDQEYYFTFDGQTIVLEDYLEIRPEKRDELLQLIREKKIVVGPWYILPDIWLVGQETLIRNLEYSYDLAKELDIPMMDIGYFPDSFGFSRAIPQLLGDLTNFRAVMIWRGIPAEVNTVPFKWKGDSSSETSILAVYLPFGYGNAASLPSDITELKSEILSKVKQLQPFSPLPVYLLQNGSDHLFPDHKMAKNLSQIKIDGMELQLTVLPDFIDKLQELMKEENYQLPEYVGELRSGHRANLLSNTYSARMWIKQWNEKVEDLLAHYAEPLSTYMWHFFGKKYPSSYLTKAWKWFLRNAPHDSICGCSADVTHEEMKFRYSWAQTIAETIVDNVLNELEKEPFPILEESSCLVFNPTNCSNLPMLIEIVIPDDKQFRSIISRGKTYDVQMIQESSGKVYDMTVGAFKFRTLMPMFPGRKLMNFYINKYKVFDGGGDTCEICLLVGDIPVGDLDIEMLKASVNEAVESRKYKRFHVLITKEIKRTSIATMVPLQAWGFTKLQLSTSEFSNTIETLQVTKNTAKNRFYDITFNKDGSFDLQDKKTGNNYKKLHYFEDWGDRGDEYTFGRIGPEHVKITDVKRKLIVSGPIFCEIQQLMNLRIYQEVDSSGQKRTGKETIRIKSIFRFYRDIKRIDIETELRNTAKDHRLRICFNLPFKTQHTLTSTHFGNIKRRGEPIIDESDVEISTGIQPQKRYIRVEDPINQSTFTLMNNGLPEIELVDGSCLAMTLLRSVGWLSKSNILERPEIAGPILATPGAQELLTKYTFNYSLIIQTIDEPISQSVDHSEVFTLLPKNVVFIEKTIPEEVLQPLIEILDSNIRISSLRVRNEKILVTLFNISDKAVTTKINLTDKITKLTPIKIDGTPKCENTFINDKDEMTFNPNEIRLILLE